jgi:hypothetical protein
MSDDLRTRIIAALLSEDDIALMADAVIRELGLREEVEILPRRSWRPTNQMHRYVTEWEKAE